MRARSKLFILVSVILAAAFAAGMALADDGVMFRKNISKTPDQETEKAAINMMMLYVPAQSADGTLLDEGITYVQELDDGEGGVITETVDTRYFAKPLISSYIDEHPHEAADPLTAYSTASGVALANFDGYVAHSLDDGASWKTVNVSRSADDSSFTLANGTEYPGAVFQMVHAVAGDRVLAAWISRYCDGGTPMYSMPDLDLDGIQDDIATYVDTFTLPPMYYSDLFGVKGTQKSVDYTAQGYPEVGEIPFGCVWAARGQLVEMLDDDGVTEYYDIQWTTPERLTSGVRDANRIEIDAVENAGFAIVWQEDPEGLRPGQGLGPGEGWSGAIVNQKTDIWYSYVGWDKFDIVLDTTDPDLPVEATLSTYEGENLPKIAVPMAMPVRISDNNMCKSTVKADSSGGIQDRYCYADFDFANQTFTLPTLTNGSSGVNAASDLCVASFAWTNPGGTTLDLCQAADERVIWGRTGASRARFSLQPYDPDEDGIADSAWMVMAYEELKAMGDILEEGTEEPIEIGKNIWYHTFDMFHPETVDQGLILNQPSYDPETGELFEPIPDPISDDVYYNTEIARRFSLMAQSTTAALASESKTSAILIYKQGILNQGGPADIFLRRVVLPADFNILEDNPYAYENVVCDTDGDGDNDGFSLIDGSNRHYVRGICEGAAINVSGSNIVACDTASADTCASEFPWDGVLEGETYPKVTEWAQTPDNLDDQSWENPYDVAKGHRGFIDGDFVMMLYAWSPNWMANSVGNDHYNLYIRRSFDGGLTWTTTPADLGGDGTTTCEWYGRTSTADLRQACTIYGAGEFEQARNVSQLVGNKVTILDPRYSPTGGLKKLLAADIFGLGSGELPYWDDAERDPSKYFIVYETGDNTTVAEGEAVPLDLFYSRAVDYGDEYEVVPLDEPKDKDNNGDFETLSEWDWLENKQDVLSGEASVVGNPGGTFFYAVWNQWMEPEPEVVTDSDDIFRRAYYNETYDLEPTAQIQYVSALAVEIGDELYLVGGAKDNDRMGEGEEIVEYAWYIDGATTPAFTGRDWKFRTTNMQPGFHSFSFTAKDNEGNWSKRKSVTIMVVEELHFNYMPAISR
jgi:hypothetical protein